MLKYVLQQKCVSMVAELTQKTKYGMMVANTDVPVIMLNMDSTGVLTGKYGCSAGKCR